MSIVIIGVLVLLFIGFLVVVWKALPTWRWYQVVGAVMTMILTMIFMFPLASALKSRNAWHKVKEDLEKQLTQVKEENRVIRNGDPNNPTAPRGIQELRRELNKAGLEAGRHWFGLRNGSQDPQTIQLAKVQPAAAIPGEPAPADDAAAPVAPTPLIPVGMIVYGFSESNIQGVEQPLPTFYLGEYIVTASTPDRVTLQPTSPLEKTQADRIRAGQAAQWSVYELLPLDAHDPFIADGSKPDDENLFGRVDDALVNGLLSSPEISDTTKAAYLRDGKAGTEIPPEKRWVKIEFTENHAIVVDSPDQRSALDGSFFDGSGRAVDSRLQRGDDGKVKFKKGEQIVVKEEAAKQLIDELGVAILKNTYYVRSLNDYRYVLRKVRQSLILYQNRKKELDYDKSMLDAALKATDNMKVSAQEDKEKLEQDRDQVVVERKVITGYQTKLKEAVAAEKRRAAQLYQENLRLERSLQKAYGTLINAPK